MNDWYFPGGGIEQNETCMEAAYRELAEELNLQREDIQRIIVTSVRNAYDWPPPPQETHGFRGGKKTFCIVDIHPEAESNTTNANELAEVHWTTFDELFTSIPHKDILERIQELVLKGYL